MRTHRTHVLLRPWSTAMPVLDPARLVAARIEPVMRQRRPSFAVDLCLAGDDGITVIPLVLVDPPTVVERDRDPLIFPDGTPGDDAFAFALSERIIPHLERLVLDGDPVVEHALTFGDARVFDAARAAGCFGAAPLRDALLRLVPYRYARRFVRSRSVRIDASDAAGGWALLRDIASGGVAAGRSDPAGAAWYGEPPRAEGRADVAIVEPGADAGDAESVVRVSGGAGASFEAVDPFPLDVGIVFDPAEGAVGRMFAVERALRPRERTLPDLRYAAAGGSAGRIAVVLGRADGMLLPSADTDEAHALVAALSAEGFDVVSIASPGDLDGVDLLHVVGAREGRRVRAFVEAARRAAIPVAIHAHDEDAARGGWWGAQVTRYCFEYGADERDVGAYLAMLAQRAVMVGDVRADAPFAPSEAAIEEADAALRDASIVFATSAVEAETIRRRTGRSGPVAVVPPLVFGAAPAQVAELVGPDPFALVHAPIGALSNQLLVARCAAEAAIPLVVAGPVADASYLERVREFGGPNLIVLAGEPDPDTAAALRAAAAVVVDAAWIGEGGARLAASVLAGARLALADRRRFDEPEAGARRFDPADTTALTRALGEAWDDALRTPIRRSTELIAALAPATVVRAIVRGYAEVA